MTFGQKLGELMQARGYKISYVADCIGVSHRTLRYWIDGKTKPHKHEFYEALANFFHVSDTFFWDNDKEIDPVNIIQRVKKIEDRLTALESITIEKKDKEPPKKS